MNGTYDAGGMATVVNASSLHMDALPDCSVQCVVEGDDA